MSGWKLHNFNTDLNLDQATIGMNNPDKHEHITITNLKYDGSGDLLESQIKERVLLASKAALEEANAVIQAELDALGD
tara:strand:- start:49 stop:282 length:234 start_codon:yes stop_codon:yes gene_type:complete